MTIWVGFQHISDLLTNPFFKDSHSQVTQTTTGNITEITKFGLTSNASTQKENLQVDRYFT